MFLVRVFVVVPPFRNAENSENVVEFLSNGCLMSQSQHTGMFAQDPPNPLDRIRINYLLIWRQTLVILLMDRIRFASLGFKQLLSIRSFFSFLRVSNHRNWDSSTWIIKTTHPKSVTILHAFLAPFNSTLEKSQGIRLMMWCVRPSFQ